MEEYNNIVKLPNGLNFYKTDLHLHYPVEIKNESETYEENVTFDDLVDKLIKQNYSLVAVCQHNSFKTIEILNKYLKDNKEKLSGIIVLLSIELNLREDIHLSLIFPPKFSEDQIRDTLIDFGFEHSPSAYSEDETIHYFENTKSVPKKDIIYILKKCREKGIIVLAPHASSKKGFDKLVDRDRNKIIKNDLLNILDCYKLKDFYKVNKKELNEKIAHIRCSDAHKLSDIGSIATWIKMDSPRFKSLQQIIYEPKLRVSIEEPISKIQSKIIGIHVDSGMMKDISVHFNENYNAIIGGTGSGKSSIIDIFKYIFNDFGLNERFKRITLNRLKDIHKAGTKFTLYLQNNEDLFKLEREIPSFESYNYPFRKKEVDAIIKQLPELRVFKSIAGDFQPVSMKLESLGKPVIFGQNELLDYSFSEMDLVKLFNSKINDKMYNEYLIFYETLRNRLKIFIEFEKLTSSKEDYESKLDEINGKIKEYNLQLEEINKNFPKKEKFKIEKNYYESLISKLESIRNQHIIYLDSLTIKLDVIKLEEIENKEIFEQMNIIIQGIQNYKETLMNFKTKINTSIDEIQSIFKNNLNPIYENYEVQFKKYCKENEIPDMIEKDNYIQLCEKERVVLITDLTLIEEKLQKHTQEKEEFLQDLEKLVKKNQDLIKNWIKKAEIFTSQMLGATKIQIDSEINFEEFELILKKLELSKEQIRKIIIIYNPLDFVKKFIENEKKFKSKLNELNFRENTINKIIGNFSEEIQVELKMCLRRPRVKFYLKKNNNFQLINELSTGERCATLLNFVFCEAKETVIIDQPEDNIDYNHIKSTIKILKEQKYKRQFIIVSHNQNLPVLSDADLILTMNNIEDKKIEVLYHGSLEDNDIYNSILNLEGGKEAFNLRKKKYLLIEI